jgi:glucuronate isomerase
MSNHQNFHSSTNHWMTERFLLSNEAAVRLYYDHAARMPVIDYHNHLPVEQIDQDLKFNNLSHAWLYGDHYKWRAMRANGVPERFCTGDAGDAEKFQAWAATVPYTLRNPLYHWTHLELQRYFGINETLGPGNAAKIYSTATELLQTEEYSVKNLLRKMQVRVLCTTDDPVDSLVHHRNISRDGFEIKVLPGFRPDKAMDTTSPEIFNSYVEKLEAVSDHSIIEFSDYQTALKKRHDYFAACGCVVADHGLEEIYADEFTDQEINNIFVKIRSGKSLLLEESRKFKSCLLELITEWNWEKGWVQQFHIGAQRNNNSRMLKLLGPDTGWDSIGDTRHAHPLANFLNRLDKRNKLTKTIIYNLNPADNEVFATMTGNFNDGSIPGKIQWGAAWWFLDQKDGIRKHLDTLSNMGLLSRFVGMLTDSRSFLSFPRHEYFRRILCTTFGEEMEKGELPADFDWIGKIIEDICYNNSRDYLNILP